MNFNYCPNCGDRLVHIALTCNPPIVVIECHRCGWQIREGRQPTWNTVSNSSTDGMLINRQVQGNATRVEKEKEE